MKIIEYDPDYIHAAMQLFYRSVHAIDDAIYSTKQKEAWAPAKQNAVLWEERLNKIRPYLALQNEYLAGFMDVSDDGYIDMAYVAPEFQRCGVARALLEVVENKCKSLHNSSMYTNASRAARPFFEKMGFEVVRENSVERSSEILMNYTMQKRID